MQPILAFVVRDLRTHLRRPHILAFTVLLPLLQFVILGNAFGGRIRNVEIAFVSHDDGPSSWRMLSRLLAVEATTGLFRVRVEQAESSALRLLRDGRISGVVSLDPDYTRRRTRGEAGGFALIVDNTDVFVAAALRAGLAELVSDSPSARGELGIVELFPFINYIQYLVPAAVMAAVYTVTFVARGTNFVYDRISGRHEGFLATPATTLQIVSGLTAAATLKAIFAGLCVAPAALFIADRIEQLTPMTALRLAAVICLSAFAASSFRIAISLRIRSVAASNLLNGVSNNLLFFPSGALYPIAGFPDWLKVVAYLNPLTYVVRPTRAVLFQQAGWSAIAADLGVLAGIGVGSVLLACILFPRRL